MKRNSKDFTKNLFIIAIGASAGGMEAIHLLFDHTLEDGVAYVIIQHLSPDHKSFMAELLAKHSKLQISIAENEMQVEPNRVYLMPQGKNMSIKNGRLLLTDSKPLQPNTSIDIFLDALAEDQGEKCIAVILSGTGTDGTKGIASVKRNGGYVIVQDPESAKFDGMPNSAIGSGNVDVIGSPESIPKEIITHLRRDKLESNFTQQISQRDETTLLKILNLIQKHTPLDFSDYKRPTIIRRVVLRMTKTKTSSLEDYADFLKANPSEINILAKEFLISVTEFFRDKEAFKVIKKEVIPEIIENKLQVDTLKVWVVGCATGEEAYSLAILIMEHLTEIKKNLEVKIFASDIDKAALQHASKGVYSETISKDVSEERLNKFFTKQNDKYKVRDNIRKMIIFADHDIVKQPPYGKIDLISCRNLLIYINPLLQKKILASLHFCLNLGGYLLLGPSESLGELRKSFSEVDKKWKIYKSTEVARNLRHTTYSTPGLENQLFNPNLNATPQKSSINSNLTELTNQTLLRESGYEAGIWVDTDFEIIQTCGNYEKYLLPKIFNFNLLEMLPEELSIATSTTLRKAFKLKKEAAIKKVRFKRNEVIHSVNVFVKPFLSEKPTVQTVALILFNEEKVKKNAEKDIEVFGMDSHTTRYVEDLKEELAENKQKLKDCYDALDVSNDNISSYNEELISSNEEMQSTNEELQSVNEELQTVNNEYQLKIKELAELNDDLDNYFKSTVNAQLYVDKDLVLRKFTPSAIRQVNLKETDVGRPLSDISTNIRFSTLMDDVAKVISSFDTVKKEVQTLEGRWYQMMALPYTKQQNNQNDGAIITFNDITELKESQDKLSKINADHDTFIYSVSHDLKGPLANLKSLTSFLEDSVGFQTNEDKETLELIGQSITNLSETIKELSDITKIENEIGVLENINVKQLIKEVESYMKDRLLKTGANVILDLKVSEIPFSKKNLRAILTNLLSNAIKYSSPDRIPEITISTEKSADFTVLSVQDNGLGIPENKKHEIFAKFKRAHTHVEGTGVGLYLVKKIITNAGGEIEVESELGKGSVFKVYFSNKPVASEE
ncbi:CheR family methyltransferase [Pleomorphovibrio marinus]|uniref:CheR family methyltransferase n=1 Tax=Pleomorphovibrio marinus TaxID=2164132 RepID=UPI0018E554E8|nr:CheR family methyltransferase [Pleomorphovibrio marinus]